jgi:hypothetical protein
MSVVYATFPFALRGARAMSVMTELCGSAGSSSPSTWPTSFSYGPTLPNERPSNVGDSMRVTLIFVMRACAGCKIATEVMQAAISIDDRMINPTEAHSH